MSRTLRGFVIILCAAFVWGIGNAITGITAHKYLSSGSLFPAIDIALANTLGGLFFVAAALYVTTVALRRFTARSNEPRSGVPWLDYLSNKSLLSGALKGANTCFFVFSTTYIVATQALILESTYIVWSLLLCVILLKRRVSLMPAALKTAFLCLGVVLISGPPVSPSSAGHHLLGPIFGIAAGLSYALFLFSWSHVTASLSNVESQLASTCGLLIASTLAILVLTEIASVVLVHRWWVPFISLTPSDIILQVINGVFVVGLTYFLVTVGMAALKYTPEGAGFVAALGLSFSIPFTLLPEFIIGKFVPTEFQLAGILLFMVAFVFMSASLSQPERAS